MNIEEEIQDLKNRMLALEKSEYEFKEELAEMQDRTQNSLVFAEPKAEPLATLDREEKFGPVLPPPDKLCKYVNGRPAAHPWHLSTDLREAAEYIRLDEDGNGIGWGMNPVRVSSTRDPSSLNKREFIQPTDAFIEAARKGQSVTLLGDWPVSTITPLISHCLHVQFRNTHRGVSAFSYYRDGGDIDDAWHTRSCRQVD